MVTVALSYSRTYDITALNSIRIIFTEGKSTDESRYSVAAYNATAVSQSARVDSFLLRTQKKKKKTGA